MKKKISKKQIIILTSFIILIFVTIITIILIKNGNNKLPRNAKWNESQNSVVKREQKDNDDVYINSDTVSIKNIDIFNDTADYIFYEFDDTNKLNEITVRFETYGEYSKKFNNIADAVEDKLGKPVLSERDNIFPCEKWSMKNTYVEMSYDTYGNIDITYKKQ